ncbi:MAG: hypothetical protein MI975_00165 [Cytophagales bacterium]|nr:hypothetical protein [Cytophagales bacterium]
MDSEWDLIQILDVHGRVYFTSGVKVGRIVRVETRGFLSGLYILRLSDLPAVESDLLKLLME